MSTVSIVIPNYNGHDFIKKCFDALRKQSMKDFKVIVVDNASEDDSLEVIGANSEALDVETLELDRNYGFSVAVNRGIQASETEYVILLNNDAYVGKHFVEELVKRMDSDHKIFSAQALMLKESDKNTVDSTGSFFSAMGWGFDRGKDKASTRYQESSDIFAACAGAAIYRKIIFEKIGYFDEDFFAYLEDVDIGYRARLHGYINVYEPKARVLHVGSGSSGSRHNEFKVGLSARNSMFVMYKNFSFIQWIINFLPIIAGIIIKTIYFGRKKLAKAYFTGITSAFSKFKNLEKTRGLESTMKIEKELIKNIFGRLLW